MRSFFLRALSAMALLLPGASVAAESWRLDAFEWSRPRTGQAVLSMAPVAEAVRSWSDAADARLLIHYPGGEEGVLWASELRDWMVALGVPSAHLRLVAGSEPGTLRIELEQAGA
jgi:hypothetical protein